MKYRLTVLNERAEFLIEELKENVTVLEKTDDDFTNLEVTINDNMELLNIFHAGVKTGTAAFLK